MKTHLRVFAIVVFILAIGCGTASAYSKSNMQSVVVNLDGVPRMVSTGAETVGELLEEISGTIDADYILDQAKDEDAVSDNMTISLTSITEKVVATTEAIPFETVEKTSPALKAGERKVVQAGKNGQTSVVNKEIYHGNKLVSSEFIEKKVLTEPVSEVVQVGKANAASTAVQTSGNPGSIDGMNYKTAINAKVTAYTPYDAGCNGITATGAKAERGVVAVDPSVIPLGSKVYVPGYGVAIAADTGGAIKGNRLDVCYLTKDEAFTWGVKDVTVYVLS